VGHFVGQAGGTLGGLGLANDRPQVAGQGFGIGQPNQAAGPLDPPIVVPNGEERVVGVGAVRTGLAGNAEAADCPSGGRRPRRR